MHEPKTTQKRFFRRREAAEFLKEGWRFGSAATLAKLAVVGGGPEFRKANRIVLYEQGALERWANAKVGPVIRSTSELALLNSYDGRTLLGSIKPLPDKRAAATAADGKRLGKFQNQTEAMHAIMAPAGTREVSR